MLYYLNVLHWLCLGVHMKKEHQIGPKRAPDQIGPPVRTTKRNSYNFWFPENMRAHEYSLEILLSLLSNPGNLTSFRPSNNKVIIKRLKTGQKVKSLLEDLSLFKFSCKTVPIYNVSWCKIYMVGKINKSTFPTQQISCHLDFPIRSYDWLSGDCTEDQQPREAPRDFSSWWIFVYHNSRNSKVHSHPARRVIPCINILCISEIRRFLIIW